MVLLVSKDCFPATYKCHNCARKGPDRFKKETDPKEDSKRCSGCHLITYCDKDCQKEHWKKVHKRHCKFLAGKTPVQNSKHDAASCAECIEQNQASFTQLTNENSPKPICNIKYVTLAMKKALSEAFWFHGDGKNCECSLQFACELPFPLGEVSGQYLEAAGTGLDDMLAHALKILTAMTVRTSKEDHKNILIQLWKNIIYERMHLWYDILIFGVPIGRSITYLSDKVNSLENFYGVSNSWWKTLKFSVNFIVMTNLNLASNRADSRSQEDPRFQNLKLVHDYYQSQLQNQAAVSEKKLWSQFLLWPKLVRGSLAVLLPPGTRCQNCYDELSGEVAVSPYEVNSQTLPCLLSGVSDNGALMTCCSPAKNPSCRENCLSKDVELRMRSDGEAWNESLKELNLFLTESRQCDVCLKQSLSSHRCSACLAVQYCSTDCQKEDLEFHKTVCVSWAKDEYRKILGKKKQKDYWESWLNNKKLSED